MTLTTSPATPAAPTRNENPVLNWDVLHSLWVAALVTGSSYLIGFALGWITSLDPLEAFAVFTSYSCTYLCVKQRRFNYPIGALSTIAYCVLFWREGLYASMILNAYLTPTLIYGWIRWRADRETRPVTHVAPRWIPVYALVTGAAFAGAFGLVTLAGGSFAVTDSLLLVGTILAQFLMDNKKLESWMVWMLVNVLAIGEYFSAGLAIAGLQYVFFLGNAVWALVAWRRSMLADRARGMQ
jgi:nicotinamide mononucleotide transporter